MTDTQQTPKATTEYCDQIKTPHSRKIKEITLKTSSRRPLMRPKRPQKSETKQVD